jgi:hypothetical protein
MVKLDRKEVNFLTSVELESVTIALLQAVIMGEAFEVSDRIAAARVALEHIRASRNQELVKSVVEKPVL